MMKSSNVADVLIQVVRVVEHGGHSKQCDACKCGFDGHQGLGRLGGHSTARSAFLLRLLRLFHCEMLASFVRSIFLR